MESKQVSKEMTRSPTIITLIGLYSNSIQLSLPVPSVEEDLKVAKCRMVMTLRYSGDNRIAGAGFQTRTGRKWSHQWTKHWKHEHWVTGRGNVTFPAVVKSVSSRKAHNGPGKMKIKGKQGLQGA